jgi:hypothetical protein
LDLINPSTVVFDRSVARRFSLPPADSDRLADVERISENEKTDLSETEEH